MSTRVILSPVLLCLVVDGLIRTLNDRGFYTQGYADDVVIILMGKHLTVVLSMMNSVLKVVENWCNEDGLSVNPEKTSMVMFIRKRKLPESNVKILGSTLEGTKVFKYVGVYLDSTSTFKPHF